MKVRNDYNITCMVNLLYACKRLSIIQEFTIELINQYVWNSEPGIDTCGDWLITLE